MKPPFVADSSIGIAWVVGSQATELTNSLLDDVIEGRSVHVPGFWFLEVANGLVVAVRRKLITEAQRRKGMELLRALPLEQDEAKLNSTFVEISELATKHHLTVYDACYLEFAKRKRLPLASRDEALRGAASRDGVELLPDTDR